MFKHNLMAMSDDELGNKISQNGHGLQAVAFEALRRAREREHRIGRLIEDQAKVVTDNVSEELDTFFWVQVQFHNYNKSYTYKSTKYVARGEQVIVNSPFDGYKIVRAVQNAVLGDADNKTVGYKWIVGTIDDTQYKELTAIDARQRQEYERQNKRNDVEKKIKKKLEEVEEMQRKLALDLF